jgi:DNA-binding transcriptional MerR regulator
VRRLAFVQRAAALGFSLTEIRGMLALRVSSRTSCETIRTRALAKLSDVDVRIAELTRMREALVQLAATCSSEPQGTCPFLDALDQRGST